MPQLTPLDFNKLKGAPDEVINESPDKSMQETEPNSFSQPQFPDDMVPRSELDDLRRLMDKVEKNAADKMKQTSIYAEGLKAEMDRLHVEHQNELDEIRI